MTTLNEYQQDALRTAGDMNLLCGALGLSGEAGEVLEAAIGLSTATAKISDQIKKLTFHGHPWTAEKFEKLVEELGDVLWYVAATAKALGWELEEIARINTDKLKARYPDGFSAERSINRS